MQNTLRCILQLFIILDLIFSTLQHTQRCTSDTYMQCSPTHPSVEQ
jgi:hypothetical protein